MHRYASLTVTSLLLLLAMVPWIVSSCVAEPLVPDEVRLERVYFEATVEAGQAQEGDERRQTPSTFQIVPLGTIAAEDAPTPTPAPLVVTPTPEPPEEQEEEAEDAENGAATEPADSTSSSTVVKVQSTIAVETPAPTVRRIIVRSEAAQPTIPPVTDIEVLTTTTEITAVVASTVPLNRVAVVDLITEQMLTEQVKRDVADAALSDLTITFTPEGVHAWGAVTLFAGIKQPLTATGTFIVENDALVARVSSIRLGGLDVTERYRHQLESGVNSSLYRLLPQRYVQSFELSQGELLVYSQVRQ